MSPDYVTHLEGGAAAEYLDDVDGRRRNQRTKEVTVPPLTLKVARWQNLIPCAPTPSTLAQSKERKGSNFAIWQP